MAEESAPLTWRHHTPALRMPNGDERGYLRVAALGDSATFGIGDPSDGAWRGWAGILINALSHDHDVSFCNLAVSGSTVADVARHQLANAMAHGPHLASLIVGLNDVLRPEWDAEQVRRDLLTCATLLTAHGTVLLTVRFHDHTRVLGIPRVLARPLSLRIEVLNAVYDEIQAHHGGLQVDLATVPEVYRREFWSIDRLHPSELGHRFLAREFAVLLGNHGLSFTHPSPIPDGKVNSRLAEAAWVVTAVVPWLGRRTCEAASWALRTTMRRVLAPW
jgi:lysophospholipase L1-like esterase